MIRLRPGEAIAGAGSLLLALTMFLDWYAPRGRAEGLDAWNAFGVLDLLLAVVVVLGLALAVSSVAARAPALPVALGVVTTAVATAAALLVLYRILNQPGPNDAIEVRTGAWLGLLATALVAGGGWVSMSDERPRASDPPPTPVERRPAPPRA